MIIADATALITGGASGIGAASARRLTALGAHIVIIDRDEAGGTALAEQIGGTFVAADVTDEDAVSSAVDIASEIAPLRVLVNAAGIGPANRIIDRNSEPLAMKRFELVVRVNLFGAFNCTRLAAAAMSKTEPVDEFGSRGSIVNIASVAAFDGQIGQAAYAASKAGIVGMTLPIARDLSSVGIRINTIAPGLVDTPIYGTGEKADAFKEHLAQSVLFPQRLGSADELASMVAELVVNDYVNGETIRVDGGIRMPPK